MFKERKLKRLDQREKKGENVFRLGISIRLDEEHS